MAQQSDNRRIGLRREGFVLDDGLKDCWAKFTDKSDEKFFRKFVRSFVSQWETKVCPNWELLVTARLEGERDEGPALAKLPDELLPALSKFLFVGRDEAEEGTLQHSSIERGKQIVKCLIIICRCPENIPLVASMDFVQQVTQMDTLLLQHLLEMESSFFARKAKTEVTQLRTEIVEFILQSCHFLESIYDPYFRWRAFLCGKKEELGDANEIPPTSVALHQETVPFLYESFETALADRFPAIAQEMITVFGAAISGARHNAIRAISPATTKMLLKTVRDSAETSEEVHIGAICASAKSIQILHELPMDERQLDLSNVIEQYEQILKSLAARDTVSLVTMIEGVSMVTRMLKVRRGATELQAVLAKNGMIETLLSVMKDCQLEGNSQKILLPVVISRISLLLKDCEVACQKMKKVGGYKQLFDVVESLGPPDSSTLQAILSMATHGGDDENEHDSNDKLIKNIEPITYLLKWIAESNFDNDQLQVWLTESLYAICSSSIQNKMLCCQSGTILDVLNVLKRYNRLHNRSAVALLRLIESLGAHSITPYELKKLIMLLQYKSEDSNEDENKASSKFPFRSHVIHVISSMAKNDGYDVCRQYFDIGCAEKGLSVPTIRHWQGPSSGFAFHCWIRLDNIPGNRLKEERRQLYSFYTTAGNGFEAFFTSGGVLVAAVASKKEFLAVPLEDYPFNDERWHCLEISHASGKRPFGSSTLSVYVDGTKRLECSLKYPSMSEPISYCQIGSPLQRGNIPALNASDLVGKQSLKDQIGDAIKFGLPGVINLPGPLKAAGGGGPNDPHIKWTLIGLEDQLWGKSASLCGQVGMICCFGDAISSSQAKMLHTLGPNQGLSFPSDDQPDVVELLSRVVFFYSARASHNSICPNLNAPSKFEAHVMAEPYCTQDVKDVINCIGGVQLLFPLLETATKDEAADDCSSIELMSLSGEEKSPCPVPSSGGEDWELVPSSSFSDWKLEQNAISGFLTLVKNLVSGHTVNLEQLMRGGGVSIIGSLLQKARPELIDVNVLMAAQLLVELAHASKDSKLLFQIYQYVLFDFRIWSRSEFHVQIGHVQYVSTIVRDDRKFFRKKFGVQFLLDVIKKHYGTFCTALSREDCRTMRASLFGLVRFYLTREVSWKEAHPVVSFLLAEKNETLGRELTEVITHYLESRQAKDQMFLIMYESKRADLLYCLLLQEHCINNKLLRLAVLRLITSLLRSNKVSMRHKYRMHLAESRYLGFMHLWFRQQQHHQLESASPSPPTDSICASMPNLPSKEEIIQLLDQMMLFDDAATFQGVLGLTHHLQWAPLDVKLEVARRVMTFIFSRPDVPQNLAKQVGWQDCLTKLLVKKILKPEDEQEEAASNASGSSSLTPLSPSPSHYIGKAAETAKHYLPSQAGETLDKLGAVASKASQNARDKANDTVLKAQSKTHQIIGKVQSGIDDLALNTETAKSRLRRNSLTPSFGPCEAADERPTTPQYMQSSFHLFSEDDLIATKSASASSEDVSISRAETTCSTPTRASDDLPDIEIVNADLGDGFNMDQKEKSKGRDEDKIEEELCQLVVNILFTVMWRGIHGASDDVVKERGQVIACINMLGLNNDLYRSYVELKRRLIEMCVQAVLSDFRDKSAPASPESYAVAQHVMQWVYDLVVFESPGKFGKKVNEPLLDGVLGMVESLIVFRDGGAVDQEWGEMAKLAFEVLLKCAESEEEEDIEICTMATAKLHALVQTRSSSPVEENAYLVSRVDKLVKKALDTGKDEHYSFIAPVMKALLAKSKDSLSLTTQLPSLNLRNVSAGSNFFEDFKTYCRGEEWAYFLEKKIAPLSELYQSGFLAGLPREMDVYWAECFEVSKIASHRRAREVGESKLRFQAQYLEPFSAAVKNESVRYSNGISQQKSHLAFIRKRWGISKRLFFGPRGAWSALEGKIAVEQMPKEYWKLANNENFLRMRMKLIPNPSHDPHLDASAYRDNVPLEEMKHRSDNSDLFQMQIAKEALDGHDQENDDSLTEEELRTIAKEQMETTAEGGEVDRSREKLIMSEECNLITFMSVVKGKFELTTSYVYFFDASPFKEGEDRHDFRWGLHQLREAHLRRFNLRRSGIEFFLVDQTNYFLNFPNNRKRNKVYTKLIAMKLPNLVYSSSSSPAEMLKSSALTQKWVSREITNFEYLMQLNTIAGRSFNDLSQYPVFPWILSDYESEKLDLTKPETFRDLSKPIGIQNEKHVDEVKTKYDSFEDPSGDVAKFHYGTHYSNSAMVLYYLVRVEPFTSLHIELQSGRFDVADRQFHSIPQSWQSLYSNLNDVKELIPEFFYFPEFLHNTNGFDLGKLQRKKKSVHDVILPKWAHNPDDFIRKHRLALESEYVSANLHHWIDLIFGFKQKGKAAVDALNVFYYCSYEGAVNLDAIKDESEREALEGMINNFGQTPSRLLKEPHPKRMSLAEYRMARAKTHATTSIRTDVFTFPTKWKPYFIETSTDRDPLVFVMVPRSQFKSFMQFGTPDTLISVSEHCALGVHGWLPYDKSGGNNFTFERDASFEQNSKTPKKMMPTPQTPQMQVTRKLFAVSPDAKHVFSGGHWDNSLQVFSVSKTKTVCKVIRHMDVITCLSLDHCGNYIMSGSRDTTSIVWEVHPLASSGSGGADYAGGGASTAASSEVPNPRPIQVLSGHDKAVSCVALSTELDMAVSGSEDGSINVYTVTEGQYVRSIFPPTFGSAVYKLDQMELSYQGHLVFTGHSKDVHSLHVYTINGHLLTSSSVCHRITAISTAADYILTGDENGDLVLRDLLTPKVVQSLALQLPIQESRCLS